MVNKLNISDDLKKTLENFSNFSKINNNTLKNGNSLRMELELSVYDKLGPTEFEKQFPTITKQIDTILSNIRVKN